MKNLPRFIALGLLASILQSAYAFSLPSDYPQVDGKEWMQPADLASYSWNDLAAICDSESGVCGDALLGWTWASVAEVNALARIFIGFDAVGSGPTQFSTLEWLGDLVPGAGFADRFLEQFDSMSQGSALINGLIQGSVRDSDWIFVWDNYTILPDRPVDHYFSVNVLTQNTLPAAGFDASLRDGEIGAWLYRAALIPAPSSLALIALGLCALVGQVARHAYRPIVKEQN